MAEPLWTSDEILQACGGLLQGRGFEATGVSFDTRSLEAGDLFVALKGERDGHAFAREAFKRGAVGALTSQPIEGPHIEVPDTLAGRRPLAVPARPGCRALRCADRRWAGRSGRRRRRA